MPDNFQHGNSHEEFVRC